VSYCEHLNRHTTVQYLQYPVEQHDPDTPPLQQVCYVEVQQCRCSFTLDYFTVSLVEIQVLVTELRIAHGAVVVVENYSHVVRVQ